MARKYSKSALNKAKPVQQKRDLSHRLEVVLDFLGDLIDGETRGRLARRAKELRLSGVK